MFIIAALGVLVYVASAFFFQARAESKDETKSIGKGILLKRIVQLYSFVLAAFLVAVFMLLMTQQLSTIWGSCALLVILAFNLFIPAIALALINPASLNKSLAAPSEQDQLLSRKGKSIELSAAFAKAEFWLVLFSVAIIIGICKMVEQNAIYLTLRDPVHYEQNQRSYQVFEIIGAFATGIFLSGFRKHASPYLCLFINAFLLVVSQVLMFFIGQATLFLTLSVILVAFIEGSTFVLAGIIAHEDYGTKRYS